MRLWTTIGVLLLAVACSDPSAVAPDAACAVETDEQPCAREVAACGDVCYAGAPNTAIGPYILESDAPPITKPASTWTPPLAIEF